MLRGQDGKWTALFVEKATLGRSIMRLSAAIAIWIVSWSGPSAAADLQLSASKHLGVASCASSVCHGKISAQSGRDVGLNEHFIWLNKDSHSRAFRDLATDRSHSIAANLGLPNATTAKICLDCHSDNVPTALRGEKFQLTEGVGCEACHGGAGKWIQTHTQKSMTHNEKVTSGLYPTELPLRRAELCLSCHMGTRDKFANHMIIGAGHPRLRFELEAFTVLQPPHFQVDADYVRRKGRIDRMNLWVAGQMQNARRYLELVQAGLLNSGALPLDFALYDCFGCHRLTDKSRWSRRVHTREVVKEALRHNALAVLLAYKHP